MSSVWTSVAKHLRGALDARRLAQFRRNYTSVSGLPSPRRNYAGLIEELEQGTRTLDADGRRRADERVLSALFFGGLSLRGLATLARTRSGLARRSLATLSPLGLGFLVGPITPDPEQPGVNLVPRCRFRAEAGERMCVEICKQPTEAFTRARGIPVVLEPDPESMSCRWTWLGAEG